MLCYVNFVQLLMRLTSCLIKGNLLTYLLLAAVVSSGFWIIASAADELGCLKWWKTTVWVKPWIPACPVHDAYSKLLKDLKNTDATSFKSTRE